MMQRSQPLRMQSSIGFWILLAAVAAFIGASMLRHEFTINTYKAFYCAGRSVLSGSNPYLLEPLRSCEHRIYAAPDFPAFAVEPAPLPGYALAPFALAALLPPNASHLLFMALLLAALGAMGWAIARTTGLSPVIATAACLSVWMISAGYGEIPPFAVAAIALCGLALQRGSPVVAAVCACAAMIQPHLALPLCAALFVFIPRTRLAFVAGALVLSAIGIASTGLHTTLAYFTTYLPLQAASEVAATDQYSLTHILHLAGIPDRTALLFGSISYAVMAVVGIVLGRRLASDLRMPALIAFTPPAFVLFGGSFVHDTQMLAALPLVLSLASRTRPVPAGLAVSAALLSVAWTQSHSMAALLFTAASGFAMGLLLFADQRQAAQKAFVLAAALTFAVILVNRLPGTSTELTTPPSASQLVPSSPASDGWKALLQSVPFWTEPSLLSEGRKIPTWMGLALLVGFSLALKPQTAREEEAGVMGTANAV